MRIEPPDLPATVIGQQPGNFKKNYRQVWSVVPLQNAGYYFLPIICLLEDGCKADLMLNHTEDHHDHNHAHSKALTLGFLFLPLDCVHILAERALHERGFMRFSAPIGSSPYACLPGPLKVWSMQGSRLPLQAFTG